ncbi:hypothetical protein RIF29_27197 [Crotalaria pallida]|uniref:DUF4283 domain-containing protein n=1 Tax=Crotalaria pallida TaxID=3830 RepID=A0AAN9EVV7_CROPI
MVIGSTRVFVNLTKYNRDDKERDKTTAKEHAVNKIHNTFQGQLSYAQVVQQNRRRQINAGGKKEQIQKVDPDWKGMRVRLDPAEWEWLNGCFVGKVRDMEMVYNLQIVMHSEGFTTIKIVPMGGDLVLLKAMEGEDFMELLKESGEAFSNWFEYIKPWGEEDVAGYRFTWLNCAGIPLHAWNDTFFTSLVSFFGTFVKSDSVTKERARLDVARILVKTSAQEFINKVQRIMINDKICSIRIMEERLVQNVRFEKQTEEVNDNEDDQENSYYDDDLSSKDTVMQRYKSLQAELCNEWVPDSVEGESTPKVEDNGEEEEDKESKKKIQAIINSINHLGEEEHVGKENSRGEQCKTIGCTEGINVEAAVHNSNGAKDDAGFENNAEKETVGPIGPGATQTHSIGIGIESSAIGPLGDQMQDCQPKELDHNEVDSGKALENNEEEISEYSHLISDSDNQNSEEERSFETHIQSSYSNFGSNEK